MTKELNKKLIAFKDLENFFKELKATGQKIAVAQGNWDILDPYRMRLLEKAKSSADILVVILFDNNVIRSLKGNGHPIFDELVRSEMLLHFRHIDYIIISPTLNLESMWNRLNPSLLIDEISSGETDLIMQRVVSSKLGSIFKRYSKLRKKPLAEN